ncbi:MAG TPA: DUF2500 domain-containing protein [Allocoleopsis sp.]
MVLFTILFIIVPIFIVIGFIIILGRTLFAAIKALAERQHNNRQPIVFVTAQVVAKRIKASGSTSTYYYCTFEDEHSNRHEFCVSGSEYGLLVEGDLGVLTYQGTRYHYFQRQNR